MLETSSSFILKNYINRLHNQYNSAPASVKILSRDNKMATCIFEKENDLLKKRCFFIARLYSLRSTTQGRT